jgi:putative ABC transport system permease protein
MLAWSFKIALADLKSSPVKLFFEIFALSSLIGLIVSLNALGEGVVQGFATEVLDTPEGRRIFVTPRKPFTIDDITWLRRQSETGFVEPNGLNINSDRVLEVAPGVETSVRLLPTGPGDPYLEQGMRLPVPGEVLVGVDLQQAFSLAPGQFVRLKLPPAGYADAVELVLEVVGVVDLGGWVGRGVLVNSALALAIDTRVFDKGVDFSSPEDQYGTGSRKEFSSLRLYAKSNDDVIPLVNKINARGLISQPREKLVLERLALEKVVSIIFRVVVLLVGVAVGIVFIAIIVRRVVGLYSTMTVLYSHGFPAWGVAAIVAIQSLAMQCAIAILGLITAMLAVRFLNTQLPDLLKQLSVTASPAIVTIDLLAKVLYVLILVTMVSITIGTCLILKMQKTSVSSNS